MQVYSPALTPANAIPAVYNWDPKLLPKARQALSNAINNTSGKHPKIVFMGDSTTRGDIMSLNSQSWPRWMSKYLAAGGVPVCDDSLFGWVSGQTQTTYDPRITALGAGWANTAFIGIGGRFFTNTTDTTAMTFTPAGQFDTCEVYTTQSNSLTGTFTADIDGATSGAGFASCNQNGAAGILKATLTASLGTHAVNIKRIANPVFILGWRCYNSAKASVEIINTAAGSSQSGDWAVTVATQIAALNADLTFINIGINDWIHAVSLATYQANMQTAITNAKATGDVILVLPSGTNASGVTDATQQAYLAVLQSLAVSNGVPLISMRDRGGDAATLSANGWLNGDGIHPLVQWDADFGRFVARLLLGL